MTTRTLFDLDAPAELQLAGGQKDRPAHECGRPVTRQRVGRRMRWICPHHGECCDDEIQKPKTTRRTAAQRRDEALGLVAERSGDFQTDALSAIRGLPADEYSGESIRVLLEAQGIKPAHHNAWGSVIMQATKAGVLKGTGKYVSMQTERSHARKTQVYRKD